MKTATLNRLYMKDRTKGILLYGTYQIPTIERADLNNQSMISCIPEGAYLCRWGYMESHDVHHYQVLSVPNRTGIFIHIATLPEQLQGCIGSDRVSIGALETWGAQEDFWLTIKEAG